MGKIAFVFSGQGDQYPGMGRELFEKYPAASDELTMTCVQASWTDTRAVTNDQGQGSFSEGDRIEVLATGNQQTANIQLEYTDNR